MKMKTKPSRIIKILLIIAALFCVILLASCSQGPYETEITSARIKGDEIEINVTLDKAYIEEHRGEKVHLLALPSAYTDEIGDYTLVGSSSVKASMDFYVPLEKDGHSLTSSAFVLVTEITTDGNGVSGGYTAVTAPKYVKNPENGAEYTGSPLEKEAIKGLQPSDVFEAEFFGAEHVLFEVDIADFMLAEYEEGAVNHIYQGTSYYFSGNMITELDKLISRHQRSICASICALFWEKESCPTVFFPTFFTAAHLIAADRDICPIFQTTDPQDISALSTICLPQDTLTRKAACLII